MTPLEKMRKKQAELHEKLSSIAPPIAPASPPPPNKPPKKPAPAPHPKPPTPLPVATVKHKCGHEVSLKQLEGQWCPACRNENKRRRAAERNEKKVAGADTRRGGNKSQRLPDGATFHASYNAETMEWTGSLCNIEGQVFTATMSGVFNLMRELDQQYRATITP